MQAQITFPVIDSLDEVLDAINGMREFQVQKKDGFIFIKYSNATKSTFPHPDSAENQKQKQSFLIRRECRGIGFEARTGNIVTRKFHKFFNLNEKPESAVENINWKRPFVVVEKLDGSLVSPIRVGKKIEYTTMLGLTNYGPQLQKFVKYCMPHIDYDKFAQDCLDKGISPLFEWCAANNVIVVKYQRDILTLIAMRYTRTGEYVPFHEMVKIAQENRIPVVQAWQDAPSDPFELIKAIREKEGIEGYVIRFDDGDMYKCKTNFYMKSHGVNPRSIRERSMWRSVFKNDIDDLISLIDFDNVLKEKLSAFRDALNSGVSKRVLEIKAAMNQSDVNNQSMHKISREALKIVQEQVQKKEIKDPIDDEDITKALTQHIQDNYLHDVKVFSVESSKLYSYMGFDCVKVIHPYWFNPQNGIMERKGAKNADKKPGTSGGSRQEKRRY